MEEMDSRTLFDAAAALDSTAGANRALAVLGFAKQCMTQVGGHLDRAGKALAAGGTPTTRGGRAASAIDALTRAAIDDSPANLLTAMHEMTRLPDVVLYRRELHEEMRRTLQQAVHSPGTRTRTSPGPCATAPDAAAVLYQAGLSRARYW